MRSPEDLVFVDLETTGLDPSTDEIIEIGAVRGTPASNNWKTFSVLVRPSGKLHGEITRITGLTDRDLQSADPIDTAFEQFLSFVGPCKLYSYNSKFDGSFLAAAAIATRTDFPNRMSCVLELTRRRLPGFSSYKLDDVCYELGIERNREHRALDDAIAAMQVYFKCNGMRAEVGLSPIDRLKRLFRL